MLINEHGYLQSSVHPNENWIGDGYYVVDETTSEGKQMARTYIDNYPFVDFEHDGEFVTNVIVLEEEKQGEQDRLEQERLEQELLDSLTPSDKEMLMAEIELNTIMLLLEMEVI